MIINHQITDFLFELFPKAKALGNDLNVLLQEIKEYYSVGIFQPKVLVDGNLVTIEIDTKRIVDEKPLFDRAIALCEKGNYADAKIKLSELLEKNPTVSEYHRILGQILSEEGNNEEAVNCLIDALKWNSYNTAALTMMGNIYYRHFNDSVTAKKYFDEALAQKPDDFTALTNYASLLLMSGNYNEAKLYFEQSYSINSSYPNSAFGLAQVLNFTGQFTPAFDYALHAIKVCKKSDKGVFDASIILAKKIAQKVIESGSVDAIINNYKAKLEKAGGLPIQIEIDDSINTSAKIEYAENYNRGFHLLKHKSKNGLTHLIMHELVHLDFAIQAKAVNEQMLFTSNSTNKNIFYKDLIKHREQLLKKGIQNDTINTYYDGVFTGINSQMFNAPIDLFIEDYLYSTYPDLKPIQFASLLDLLQEGKEAVTNKEAISLSPVHVMNASRVLNLVSAMHFKNLFGIDYITEFNANKFELNLAIKLYEEYNEYRQDRQAGEEYELVQNWAEDLKLNQYFELINEVDYRRRSANVDSLVASIEADPFGEQDNLNEKEREMRKFLDSQEKIGLNSAVIYYMVGALEYLSALGIAKVKDIAYEIAMLGTQGIKTSSDAKYKLSKIPNKSFSGYQLLAYYYVSFKLAVPEILPELQLPYDAEYLSAEQIYNQQ